jgi:hypothetical protein
MPRLQLPIGGQMDTKLTSPGAPPLFALTGGGLTF